MENLTGGQRSTSWTKCSDLDPALFVKDFKRGPNKGKQLQDVPDVAKEVLGDGPPVDYYSQITEYTFYDQYRYFNRF